MGATDIDTASREAGRNVVRFGDDTGPYRQRMARAFQDGSAYDGLSGPAAAAAARYNGPLTTDGPVRANLMRGQFGAPGENLQTLRTASGKSAQVHSAAAPSFDGFIKELEGQGYKIREFGGFSNRDIVGARGRKSQHAYGNAIDLNPGKNPLGTSLTDLPENTRALARKYGLIWGMDWKGRKDPMHFEWNGTRPWLEQEQQASKDSRKPEVLADPRDERRVPEDGLKQLQPWTKRHPAEGGLKPRLVDMDDDGGMYGGTGVLKEKDEAFEAWLKRMHEEEAKNPITPEQLEQQRRASDRDAFLDEMKVRAGRGTKFGAAENQAVRDPSRPDLGTLNRHLGSGRNMYERWTGEHEDDDALRRSKLQERSSDPAYRPDRDLTLDEIRRFRRPEPAARSPRFMDPASFSLKPGAGGDQNSGAAGSARFGLGGPKVEQHFHGGFDAQEVGRRAQLEQNREIRRSQAGALHDVGHPVSV
jgi:hypothetical protein